MSLAKLLDKINDEIAAATCANKANRVACLSEVWYWAAWLQEEEDMAEEKAWAIDCINNLENRRAYSGDPCDVCGSFGCVCDYHPCFGGRYLEEWSLKELVTRQRQLYELVQKQERASEDGSPF